MLQFSPVKDVISDILFAYLLIFETRTYPIGFKASLYYYIECDSCAT